MRVSFDPGTETLRVPWGTPQTILFHDGELGLDLAVRARGFAVIEQAGEDPEGLCRQTRKAAAEALRTLLETNCWTWSDLERRRETLEEAMEEALAGEGRKMSLCFDDIQPDEASRRALCEIRAAQAPDTLPPAPVDNPMIDGPGAYPQGPGGFGLYRETPSLPLRICPSCGRAEPPQANFCTQCGAKLSR